MLKLIISRPVPKLVEMLFAYGKSHEEKEFKVGKLGCVALYVHVLFVLPLGWAFEVNYSPFKYSFIHSKVAVCRYYFKL